MKLPIITSAPHNGYKFDKFEDRIILTPWQKDEFSDRYTAETAYFENALDNLKSTVSRALGSLNQPRDPNLIKSHDFLGNRIWKEGKELTEDEKEYCLKKFHDPYYKEIKKLIKKSATLGFNKVILWDHHDTGDYDPATGKRDRKLPGENRSMPKFILSNFGVKETGEVDPKNGYHTCPVEFIQAVRKYIASEFDLETYEVEINTSYKGGFIIQNFGNPENNFGNEVYAIQIEYNRGFIMNQETREPYWDVIRDFNKKFNRVMEKAVELL